MQFDSENHVSSQKNDKELHGYLSAAAKFYQRERNKFDYSQMEKIQKNEDILNLRTKMISNLFNWRKEYEVSFKQFELSVHILDTVLSQIHIPLEKLEAIAAISFFLSLKINGDFLMTTTELLGNLKGKVEDENEIRQLELLVLNKLGWVVDVISSLETTRMLMRKFFEFNETDYDIDRVQGYLEGFILVATYDQQFLDYNNFERGLITAFAFLDMIDAEECRQGFFNWIYQKTSFPMEKIDTGRFLLIKTHLNDFEGTPVEQVVKSNLLRSLKNYLKPEPNINMEAELESDSHQSPTHQKKFEFDSPTRDMSTFDNTPEQRDHSVLSFSGNRALSFNGGPGNQDDDISMIDEKFEEGNHANLQNSENYGFNFGGKNNNCFF